MSLSARFLVVYFNFTRLSKGGFKEHIYTWSLSQLYTKTYTRCGPYCFGMVIAYCYQHKLIDGFLNRLGCYFEFLLDVAAVVSWFFIAYYGPGDSVDLNAKNE